MAASGDAHPRHERRRRGRRRDDARASPAVDLAAGASPAVSLAAPDQIREIKDLLAIVRLPEGTTEKWFAKAGVDVWEDMPADVLQKCIEYVKNRLPSAAAAA